MPVLFDSSQPPKKKESQPVNGELVEPKHASSLTGKEENHSMGAFVRHPRSIHFATQGKNEQIILFLRQHPITQLPWVLSALILIFIPIFVFPLLFEILPFTVPGNYATIFTLFWYLVVFAYIFINFILWYYNVNIVTNQRVIDIDFIYLLVQEVSATRITQVEDVTYKRVGVFAALFDYGDVFVQTAGTESNIEFLQVPRPKQISQIIIQLLGEAT